MSNEDLYHIAHYLDDNYQIMMWKKDEEEWQMFDDSFNNNSNKSTDHEFTQSLTKES